MSDWHVGMHRVPMGGAVRVARRAKEEFIGTDQMQDRSNINMALSALQTELQQYVEQHDRRTAPTKFSAAAWEIIDSVPDSESSYVFHRLGCMMSGAGLIPGQDEGEQCPIGD